MLFSQFLPRDFPIKPTKSFLLCLNSWSGSIKSVQTHTGSFITPLDLKTLSSSPSPSSLLQFSNPYNFIYNPYSLTNQVPQDKIGPSCSISFKISYFHTKILNDLKLPSKSLNISPSLISIARLNLHKARHLSTSSKNFSTISESNSVKKQESTKVISWKVMRHIFVTASIPMIGFGLMDQFVMIRAGELIDSSIGVTFGLATLSAAAVGQLCSDTCGVLFGSSIDSLVQRLGFQLPDLSLEQRKTLSYRLCNTFGAVFGVILGCCLGMLQLFFMDLDRAERRKRQKELDTIFEMVMSDGPQLFHCQRGTLFVYDKTRDEIWSKAVFGLEQAIRLQKNKTKSFTTWVLENKEILNCPDASSDSRFNPVYDQKYKCKTRSVLAAPVLQRNGDVMAVLVFINKHRRNGGFFTEDDERMLKMMCKHIQIFMEKFNYGAAEDQNMISIREYDDMLENYKNNLRNKDHDTITDTQSPHIWVYRHIIFPFNFIECSKYLLEIKHNYSNLEQQKNNKLDSITWLFQMLPNACQRYHFHLSLLKKGNILSNPYLDSELECSRNYFQSPNFYLNYHDAMTLLLYDFQREEGRTMLNNCQEGQNTNLLYISQLSQIGSDTPENESEIISNNQTQHVYNYEHNLTGKIVEVDRNN